MFHLLYAAHAHFRLTTTQAPAAGVSVDPAIFTSAGRTLVRGRFSSAPAAMFEPGDFFRIQRIPLLRSTPTPGRGFQGLSEDFQRTYAYFFLPETLSFEGATFPHGRSCRPGSQIIPSAVRIFACALLC